jgi:formyl-CoA transferase
VKALAGITVLDLSRIIAGPYCTQVLGDLGANVLKVEQPGSGDPARGYGPPDIAEGQDSAYFVALNRNKRSLTLNLQAAEGQAIARQLATRSDVLIHNFKYGEAEKMGLGYAELSQSNPGLIYCTISAYGPEGPYRHRPGFDFLIQAQSGIMSLNGPADSPPTRVGPVAVVDITTGLFASNAIMAALLAVNSTRKAQASRSRFRCLRRPSRGCRMWPKTI